MDSLSAGVRNPDWFLDERLSGTLNHQARTHRKDDLWRYLFASCVVKENARPFHIRDFPPGLRPGHKNIESSLENGTFTDRFCVVPESEPSKTVTSHICKDGHYYIHYSPTQCRSLTVREAARLQTFRTITFSRAAAPSSTSRWAMPYHLCYRSRLLSEWRN